MKRFFMILLILLLAGAWLGQLMVQDPGYVLLAYRQTTIETSLWVLALMAILAFAVLHTLLNLLSRARVPGATGARLAQPSQSADRPKQDPQGADGPVGRQLVESPAPTDPGRRAQRAAADQLPGRGQGCPRAGQRRAMPISCCKRPVKPPPKRRSPSASSRHRSSWHGGRMSPLWPPCCI